MHVLCWTAATPTSRGRPRLWGPRGVGQAQWRDVAGARSIRGVDEGYCEGNSLWGAIIGKGIQEEAVERVEVHWPDRWLAGQIWQGYL